MKAVNFIKTHKLGLLSAMLVILACALGADASFAMAAVEAVAEGEVEPAAPGNPSSNLNPYDASTNPGGRPADETLQTDEQGGKTQLQGKAATATDVRDAGLEAEDYDADVDNFRKFAFPAETYFARQCRPVKAKSYEHGHFRSGSTNLTAEYVGSALTITPGTNISGKYVAATNILTLAASDFTNPQCLLEYSTVVVKNVAGYKKNEAGTQVVDGELVLFVLDHKDADDKVKFKIVNPSTVAATTMTIPALAKFFVMATAGSESQMHVASETYLPEKFIVYLQKKITTCIITDAFEDQEKKISQKTKDVLASAEYNFKRKCARSHWNGTKARIDIVVPETGNREAVYFENGVLRQINMLYTFTGDDMTDNDLLALTTLMFTNNSMSDEATVFCGKKAMKRFICLVNSADKYKDVGKVEVNNYGIKVRKYQDNFGTLEFVWDPTLDDLGYEDYMAILDLRHATRPYLVNEKKTTRDMSKTGEAREAKEHNLCKIDCIALNGFNSILVCPADLAAQAAQTGGIVETFQSVAALPSGEGHPTTAEKAVVYVLSANDTTAGFEKGDVVKWDNDLDDWTYYTGTIRA